MHPLSSGQATGPGDLVPDQVPRIGGFAIDPARLMKRIPLRREAMMTVPLTPLALELLALDAWDAAQGDVLVGLHEAISGAGSHVRPPSRRAARKAT